MSKTNFSVQEMELLVNLVENYKHILNCKITNAVFNKKKEEAWDSLTTDFNAASLYERLAAMGALIEPLPCRFDCDYVYETAVSSGTQENQGTLCSTPFTTAPQIRKSKRKPNASVKSAEALAEAANARKVAMERDYEQIAQFREEDHRATMTNRKRKHFLKIKVLKAKLEHYDLLNKKNKFDLEKEN
ncbi:hypothetical protein TNCT_734521 [Trichonephila clavata]|uniref:Regulatory protein zeste n=1 Tax=Trichonephila clavata TaxID=2740835 RepID=A0A8X6KVA8_TRICU|nr:hypothetical protein TNCT_734521 [Trichonephila clavata]